MKTKDILINILVKYGKAGAGKPSYRGVYETQVPACLKKSNK